MWIRIACGYLAILIHCNYYLITFWLMKSVHSCKPFLHCFILQLLSKLCDLFCELCVCLQIYVLNLIWYQSLGGKDTSPPYISYWIIFRAKFLLRALHQKRRIYHLISQVRKLLIKLAWSTMLGVKEIPKVQTVNLTLYVDCVTGY